MASFLFQEAIFHEDNIRFAAINTVENLSFHSMSSITNDEDVFLVRDHSEPSPKDEFSLYESTGSKDGQG